MTRQVCSINGLMVAAHQRCRLPSISARSKSWRTKYRHSISRYEDCARITELSHRACAAGVCRQRLDRRIWRISGPRFRGTNKDIFSLLAPFLDPQTKACILRMLRPCLLVLVVTVHVLDRAFRDGVPRGAPWACATWRCIVQAVAHGRWAWHVPCTHRCGRAGQRSVLDGHFRFPHQLQYVAQPATTHMHMGIEALSR